MYAKLMQYSNIKKVKIVSNFMQKIKIVSNFVQFSLKLCANDELKNGYFSYIQSQTLCKITVIKYTS